jgi:hypothetical protein
VDGETWLNALSPSSDFEYLVIPARNFQRPISIGGGMAMKQEMNEYSTFDRLYREIRAVRSGLSPDFSQRGWRKAASCGINIFTTTCLGQKENGFRYDRV